MRAAASDEFGATYIDVRKCIRATLGRPGTDDRSQPVGKMTPGVKICRYSLIVCVTSERYPG
jgi:hypothetical protein